MRSSCATQRPHLDLGRASYNSYGVKYIDQVALVTHHQAHRPTEGKTKTVMRHIRRNTEGKKAAYIVTGYVATKGMVTKGMEQ